MSGSDALPDTIALGDPVPPFNAVAVTGEAFDLLVAAGRWIVLCFVGSVDDPRAQQELAGLLRSAPALDEDHLVLCGVLTAPPQTRVALVHPAISFLADYDRALTRAYGAVEMRRTVVLDPMLRAVANIPWDHPQGHLNMLRGVLESLPAVDDSAGVPLTAPVLIVPRVFEFPLCDLLVKLYEEMGGRDSGFLLDVDGKTQTVVDHRLKRRSDMPVFAPELRQVISERIVRRLLPAVERFFQFTATRMDRSIVACYDSAVGGHFARHRDNVNAGAQHRRFAITLNLTGGYDGCDLVFPEFGRRVYRAPVGGAVVFSCGALHQVTPITAGRRLAFLAFLYGEADAVLRRANNARLREGEELYDGTNDLLYPAEQRARRS